MQRAEQSALFPFLWLGPTLQPTVSQTVQVRQADFSLLVIYPSCLSSPSSLPLVRWDVLSPLLLSSSSSSWNDDESATVHRIPSSSYSFQQQSVFSRICDSRKKVSFSSKKERRIWRTPTIWQTVSVSSRWETDSLATIHCYCSGGLLLPSFIFSLFWCRSLTLAHSLFSLSLTFSLSVQFYQSSSWNRYILPPSDTVSPVCRQTRASSDRQTDRQFSAEEEVVAEKFFDKEKSPLQLFSRFFLSLTVLLSLSLSRSLSLSLSLSSYTSHPAPFVTADAGSPVSTFLLLFCSLCGHVLFLSVKVWLGANCTHVNTRQQFFISSWVLVF